jgi:hypothetical protein
MFEAEAADEVWVNTTEAASITGYNKRYLKQLASKCWNQPEDERPIKLVYRTGRYEFWLPDLITYLTEIGHGPKPKRIP